MERVIILPNESTNYKIVSIDGKQYLLNVEIYEINVVDGNDIKHNGEAVKSYIFESNPGKVLKSANTIVATKFDITWLLIRYFCKNDQNYKTVEDIKDSCGMDELPDNLMIKSFEKICDSIVEGDEYFYKYSKENALNWVNGKVLKLQSFILNEPNSIIGKIKKELNDPSQETDPELIKLLALQYSLDYISVLKDELILHSDYDFTKVQDYLKQMKEKEKKLAVSESNINETIGNNNKTKKKPTKKETKKSVGRGPLDSFFKKA
ncbi:unnamed protein product [Candida verbasci]|uniref:Ribonuclease H2 subunit B n=1 Tax=Candida verbasci TaxID=1227364 RepID=A0A9W4TTV9_9ASCO|nr:unnamed protein product [Candida verbasci]